MNNVCHIIQLLPHEPGLKESDLVFVNILAVSTSVKRFKDVIDVDRAKTASCK